VTSRKDYADPKRLARPKRFEKEKNYNANGEPSQRNNWEN
jgi:hypothetical protein